MNSTAKLKIIIVIMISIVIGWAAFWHLQEASENSPDRHNYSESVNNIVDVVTYVVLFPGLMMFAYITFCMFHAATYPFISRYAYRLFVEGFRYRLVKGKSGWSSWNWVKAYGNLSIEVAHHGHMADRNLKFRNKVTYFITGIDMRDEDLVAMELNERVNKICPGSRVYTIDPKGGMVVFSINDYFDTSDYKQSLKAAEFVLKSIKEYNNKQSHRNRRR